MSEGCCPPVAGIVRSGRPVFAAAGATSTAGVPAGIVSPGAAPQTAARSTVAGNPRLPASSTAATVATPAVAAEHAASTVALVPSTRSVGLAVRIYDRRRSPILMSWRAAMDEPASARCTSARPSTPPRPACRGRAVDLASHRGEGGHEAPAAFEGPRGGHGLGGLPPPRLPGRTSAPARRRERHPRACLGVSPPAGASRPARRVAWEYRPASGEA